MGSSTKIATSPRATGEPLFRIRGVTVGVTVCEDIWYPDGPAAAQARAGAELLVNISASPFFVGKQGARERMLATRAADSGAIVAYVNLVGGQDELIFDGSARSLTKRASCSAARAPLRRTC